MGEYAVLHGKYAVVAAVNKRISVTLAPRADDIISITSALGTYKTTLSQIKIVSPFQFVLTAFSKLKNKLKTGCDVVIESEFSHQIGFASSAAVTAATLAALFNWLNVKYTDKQLIKIAREVIQTVQGIGSGADIAACVMGGIIAYRANPFFVEKFPYSYPLSVVYSGSKTPTVEAINRVKNKFSQHELIYKKIIDAIGECSREAIDAIKNQHWQKLGELMNMQQGLMDALGVNTIALNNIVNDLRNNPAILGAKISGSGFGDCVVALGAAEKTEIAISQQGVQCEKI